MTDAVLARSAIEALRSGVPSRHAVSRLGTTQDEVEAGFKTALDCVSAGEGAEPVVVIGNFGTGKSHLLEYLQSLAERSHFVTSYAVVSPEMPLGNPHVVLRNIAEAARAPGRVGNAARAVSTDLHCNSGRFADLRVWARDAGLNDRFPAMLHLYEEFRADEEFRVQVLEDLGGKPLLKTEIRKRLKEIGQAAGYDLYGGPRNAVLAHERIRILARFYVACGCKGWIVFFDELERVARFTRRQRVAAWQELGWWRQTARQAGSAIVPVLALTPVLQETAGDDEARFCSYDLMVADDALDLARAGAGLIKPPGPHHLKSPTDTQKADLRYRIKALYEEAYGMSVADANANSSTDVHLSLRTEIRKWIALWDLGRYYPDDPPEVEAEEVVTDQAEIPDELLPAEEDTPATE